MPVLYPGRIGIWRCWFLWREENWRTRRKTLGAGTRPNNKLNSHTAPGERLECKNCTWYDISDKMVEIIDLPCFRPKRLIKPCPFMRQLLVNLKLGEQLMYVWVLVNISSTINFLFLHSLLRPCCFCIFNIVTNLCVLFNTASQFGQSLLELDSSQSALNSQMHGQAKLLNEVSVR